MQIVGPANSNGEGLGPPPPPLAGGGRRRLGLEGSAVDVVGGFRRRPPPQPAASPLHPPSLLQSNSLVRTPYWRTHVEEQPAVLTTDFASPEERQAACGKWAVSHRCSCSRSKSDCCLFCSSSSRSSRMCQLCEQPSGWGGRPRAASLFANCLLTLLWAGVASERDAAGAYGLPDVRPWQARHLLCLCVVQRVSETCGQDRHPTLMNARGGVRGAHCLTTPARSPLLPDCTPPHTARTACTCRCRYCRHANLPAMLLALRGQLAKCTLLAGVVAPGVVGHDTGAVRACLRQVMRGALSAGGAGFLLDEFRLSVSMHCAPSLCSKQWRAGGGQHPAARPGAVGAAPAAWVKRACVVPLCGSVAAG